MLIRRPAAEVFEALIDPEQTSKFWFTRESGRLEQGKKVQWDWAMYDVSVQVTVVALERERRVLIEWPGYDGPATAGLPRWTGCSNGCRTAPPSSASPSRASPAPRRAGEVGGRFDPGLQPDARRTLRPPSTTA